jgi:hypothetical protein
MEKTVIYEITASVQPELAEKYEDYMRRHHIPDLLATGYFQGAAFTASSTGRYRIRYEAYDQEALDKYLSNDASRLRADFASHFPEGAELSREVWRVLQIWTND